jgi:acetoin utilization deacetylase AcuC-like enzyme/GNAT superfamily N-acetyltransferase
MFRIRRVYDDVLPIDREHIQQALAILRSQFTVVKEESVQKVAERLRKPQAHGFSALLFVADDLRRKRVLGLAYVLRDPETGLFFLDYLAAPKGMTGRGVGGALYQRVREEALQTGAVGVFFECLPDDPALSRNPAILKENVARLKFYEEFGARPIAGTAYETPVKPGDDNPPYLVFDGLGRNAPLKRDQARRIVRSILEKKYAKYCPPEYVRMVVDSFRDDPVRIREPRYRKGNAVLGVEAGIPEDRKIRLIINREHVIHHIRERGYVEAPVRVPAILNEIEPTGLFAAVEKKPFPDGPLRKVHDGDMVDFVKRLSARLTPEGSIYPYIFPIRNIRRMPDDLELRAGYYEIDTFTPINGHVYPAARAAVDCGLTAAECLTEGYRLAYALVRPPGHHAERRVFGGFCYFNTAAIAADQLSHWGRVAVLDIDYHHGNGTQEIFYARRDVLTISLHGHPQFAYPYFSGFADERGRGTGAGFNFNYPLPETLEPLRYKRVLAGALRRIMAFKPVFLVVSLGLDTAKGDPTGSWSLKARDFRDVGRMIGILRLPTLIVQEGGYNTRNLGLNARHFFLGLYRGYYPPGIEGTRRLRQISFFPHTSRTSFQA